MEHKELFLTILAIFALLLGFAYSYYNPMPMDLGEMPFTAMAAGILLAGTIFFGYAAFIPMLAFGLQLGADKNAAIFLFLVPSIIAAYAGTKLGVALSDDYSKKSLFTLEAKKILLLAVIAIILAVAVEIALPYIIQYWPKDYLGLNPHEGETVADLIGQLSGLIMH